VSEREGGREREKERECESRHMLLIHTCVVLIQAYVVCVIA
jgi:hypothetical protein